MFKFADLKKMERLQPMASDLDWLRERFRNPVVDEPSDGDNIVSFRRAHPATDHSETALELVDQAAEVVSGIEDNARQIEARAQFLVKSALEKMQLSDGRVEAANQALKLAQSRLATAEGQLMGQRQPQRLHLPDRYRLRPATGRRSGCRSRATQSRSG